MLEIESLRKVRNYCEKKSCSKGSYRVIFDVSQRIRRCMAVAPQGVLFKSETAISEIVRFINRSLIGAITRVYFNWGKIQKLW